MDAFQQPNVAERTQRSRDIMKAELDRKKRDLYKILNPTNQQFQIVLNAKIQPEIWTIEARGELIVPKYVRDKYLEEMSQKIITAKADKAVIAENEKRMGKGFDKMDLHTQQYQFESRQLKTMMSKRDQIVMALDGGLFKEYGVSDGTPKMETTREDIRSFDPGILEETPKPSQPAVQPVAVVHNPVSDNPPQGNGKPPPEAGIVTPNIPDTKPTIIEELDEI